MGGSRDYWNQENVMTIIWRGVKMLGRTLIKCNGNWALDGKTCGEIYGHEYSWGYRTWIV